MSSWGPIRGATIVFKIINNSEQLVPTFLSKYWWKQKKISVPWWLFVLFTAIILAPKLSVLKTSMPISKHHKSLFINLNWIKKCKMFLSVIIFQMEEVSNKEKYFLLITFFLFLYKLWYFIVSWNIDQVPHSQPLCLCILLFIKTSVRPGGVFEIFWVSDSLTQAVYFFPMYLVTILSDYSGHKLKIKIKGLRDLGFMIYSYKCFICFIDLLKAELSCLYHCGTNNLNKRTSTLPCTLWLSLCELVLECILVSAYKYGTFI